MITRGLGNDLDGLAAFRRVYGEDPTPESISAAVAEPAVSAGRLVEAWLSSSPSPSTLTPLASGELRPLIANRSAHWQPFGFRRAETELDRLVSVLLYAHGAVMFDPCSYLEISLRKDELTADCLLGVLHTMAFVAPLVDRGIVQLVPRPTIGRGHRQRGPLPSARFRSHAPYEWMEKLEKNRGWFKTVEPDLRPSRNMREKTLGRNAAIELVEFTNAMRGRAHLLQDGPLDPDSAYAENGTLDRLFVKAVMRRMLRGDFRKLVRLIQQPLPDLSIVRPLDLLLLRDLDGFAELRHRVGGTLERYEIGLRAGRSDVGRGLAAELRAEAAVLEAEVEKSRALSAVRRGLATLAVTGAGTLSTLPLHGEAGIGVQLATPASAAVIETLRALVTVRSTREQRTRAATHATAARALAERYDCL